MSDKKSNKILRQLGFIAVFSFVTAFHFLVTFVVILFILSTINIVNRNIFRFEKLDYFEIIVSAIIFIISARIYFRSFKKISQFVKNNFFPDLLR